jgi:signal transduction histidine kinase
VDNGGVSARGTQSGLARLVAALALAAALPSLRPVGLAGALAVFLAGYAILAGWQSLTLAGWRGAALLWADAGVAAGAAGVVAAVADPRLIPLGVAATLPLVLTDGREAGLAAGLRTGGLAVGAGTVTALVSNQPLAAGAVAAFAPLAAWLARAGSQGAINERHQAELAEDARRVRTEMVTTVSHELRTPLTVIKGAMATLSRRWDVLSEPERLDLLDVLIDNVASLDASLLHFVDAGRLERGSFEVVCEWVDLPAVVDGMTEKLAGVLSGHEVQRNLEADRVWADPKALARILEHLLVNAVRFSPVGLPIRIRSVVQEDEVVIAVSDRGQGIAPHLLPTVWEPLQRGDVSETGVSRGAGLGLPIVRELARLHGGDADLTSVKGHGTTVIVRLPLPAAEPDATETKSGAFRRRRRGAQSPA